MNAVDSGDGISRPAITEFFKVWVQQVILSIVNVKSDLSKSVVRNTNNVSSVVIDRSEVPVPIRSFLSNFRDDRIPASTVHQQPKPAHLENMLAVHLQIVDFADLLDRVYGQHL